MTITNLMSVMADTAAQRYGLFVEALQGLHMRALRGPRFGSDSQMGEIAAEAYDMARLFLDGEEDRIAEDSVEIATEAHRSSLRALDVTTAPALPDDVSAHLNSARDYLRSEITVQVERDIATLLQAVRRTVLSVRLAARARRIPERVALAQHIVGAGQGVDFFFHDRRGSKWPSRKFVRSVWRLHLLSLYNEVVLMALADHGVDRAQIVHVDPSSDVHGMEVSLTDNTSLPTYADIRAEIFHPNANAVLTRAA